MLDFPFSFQQLWSRAQFILHLPIAPSVLSDIIHLDQGIHWSVSGWREDHGKPTGWKHSFSD